MSDHVNPGNEKQMSKKDMQKTKGGLDKSSPKLQDGTLRFEEIKVTLQGDTRPTDGAGPNQAVDNFLK